MNRLKKELKAMKVFAMDALSFPPYIPRHLPKDAHQCIIAKGLCAPDFVYNPLRHFLEYEMNIQTHMQPLEWVDVRGKFKIFWRNLIPNYLRKTIIVREHYQEIRQQYGKVDFFIAHSLGGPEILPFVSCSDLRKAIVINGVFNEGKQWWLVAQAEKWFYIPEPLKQQILHNVFSAARRYAHKIITIAAEGDYLVPFAHAAFPGAMNHVYALDQDASFRNSHTYLPNTDFVKDIIRKEFL